jgi:hypothetical protein
MRGLFATGRRQKSTSNIADHNPVNSLLLRASEADHFAMPSYVFWCLASAALFTAAKGWGSLLQSPGPSQQALYVSPLVYNHSLIGPESSSHASAAWWYACQWDNPAPATAVTAVVGGAGNCTQGPGIETLWSIDTGAYRVCSSQGPSEYVFELFADGSGRGGAPQVACGAEFDAFLSPTATDYRGVPINFAPRDSTANPTLAELAALNIRFSMQVCLGCAVT